MKVTVNLGFCQGYGNCVSTAPAFFGIGDSGQAVVLRATVETPEDIARVRETIPLCPMNAIALVG
jgi:ferredoxin